MARGRRGGLGLLVLAAVSCGEGSMSLQLVCADREEVDCRACSSRCAFASGSSRQGRHSVRAPRSGSRDLRLWGLWGTTLLHLYVRWQSTVLLGKSVHGDPGQLMAMAWG